MTNLQRRCGDIKRVVRRTLVLKNFGRIEILAEKSSVSTVLQNDAIRCSLHFDESTVTIYFS